MVISGIVSELNPFHKGHEYIFGKARKITGSDYVIAVMSGDFVQRGLPAVCDKYTRTKMALMGGADLVLELPAVYATASADYFAFGAVSLLSQLNCVDYLCFGSETGDVDYIKRFVKNFLSYDNEAHILGQGNKNIGYRSDATEYFREGKSFVKAFSQDVGQNLGSNDMLASCYVKSLLMLGASIKPVAVKRVGSAYLDSGIDSDSAMAIRKRIIEGKDYETVIPDYVYSCLKDAEFDSFPILIDDFSVQLFTRIDDILKRDSNVKLSDFMDVSVNMEGRIKSSFADYISYSDFIDAIHSKEYTKSRIMRALLHILLNIKKSSYCEKLENCISPYARVLGFRKGSGELLSVIKENSLIPIISKARDAVKILDDSSMDIFDIDIHSANFYEQCCAFKYGNHPIHDFSKEIVII